MHPYDYGWGSNMTVLTNAMVLCFAQRLTGDDKYLQSAMYQLDYIFGRNALAISYVTGHGENAIKEPHNRPTIVDEIEEATIYWNSPLVFILSFVNPTREKKIATHF